MTAQDHGTSGSFPGRIIRIDSDGCWFFDDHPIDHAAVLDLLRKSLQPDGRGGWEIHSDFETRPVEVEDTPLFVSGILPEERGGYVLLLDDGSTERLDPASLERDDKGILTRVREGVFPARFNRTGFIALGHLLEERADGRLFLPVPGGEGVELGP